MSYKIVRVGSVSYVNARPLTYGFEKGGMSGEVELVRDYPSAIAEKLVSGDIDVGLVPVAIIPKLSYHQVISGYGIACDGEVASVCILSDCPLEQVTEIWMDYQSRTSVALAGILMKEYWKINPVRLKAQPGYEEAIAGTRAGLVIGDRALVYRNRYQYVYDLGLAWKEMTGLPFVFAAWISNKALSPEFCQRFDNTTSYGLQHLDEVISNNPYDIFSLRDYYTKYIKFRLTEPMQEAITLFLKKLETAR